MSPRAFAVLAALLTSQAAAQEAVTAKGKLSDEDFYRLVACAAPPGEACQKPFVRWSATEAQDLTVRIVQVDDGYPGRISRRAEEVLDSTLAELNASGAALHLRKIAPGLAPDISIHLLDLPRDTPVAGTGLPWFDGNVMQAARFQLGWHHDGTAFICGIALSRDIAPEGLRRILLEELTQCLGLMTDVNGLYYASRSIFSEQGARMNRLQGQDLAALLRHYP